MQTADRVYLTEIMAQIKIAEDDRDAAQKEVTLWTNRMALARAKNARDLYEAARARAEIAQDSLRSAESAIMELEVEKSSFKNNVRVGDPADVAQAQHLVASLKGTDLDPEQAQLSRMAKEADADDELAALKASMGIK